MLSRGIGLLLEKKKKKKKEVIHAPEPSYEETALSPQTVGGIWASPPSAVPPGLAFHLSPRHFPGKKERLPEATMTNRAVLRPHYH